MYIKAESGTKYEVHTIDIDFYFGMIVKGDSFTERNTMTTPHAEPPVGCR